MKPLYSFTTKIVNLLSSISEKIGEVNAARLNKPSPELRKRNRIRTIRASLEIEGNTLSEAQITAIVENRRVVGPKQDIKEVLNAIKVYDLIGSLDPTSMESFLQAHQILLDELIEQPGQLRTRSVSIFKGDQVAHLAPPAANVHYLISELFSYLKESQDHPLIKSCVVHYEIEFIHPFMDGNGRMGRLWQTLILLKHYPIFEYLPFETVIKEHQQEYYDVLERCDRQGASTEFIEFMLGTINEAFDDLLQVQERRFSPKDRVRYFLDYGGLKNFTRKEYMDFYKEISSSTASRDLRGATKNGLIAKSGDKGTTTYKRIV